MNDNYRINLIRCVTELEGLTDRERSALLGLLRESKTYKTNPKQRRNACVTNFSC